MSIDISPQIETRLAEEARRRGISVDALLEQLINERATSATSDRRKASKLPVWRLGALGPFHRRDLYDDGH